MKLLIVTQKVDINDDVLGFFHGWIREFAKHCEKVTVVCLCKGEYDLPGNVKVYSLGKEKKNFQFPISNFQSLSRISYIFKFYKYIFEQRKNYTHVFVHMNAIYAVLGGFFWRIWEKRTALWYTHKQVSPALRLAEKLVHRVFTASRNSFRLPSKKLKILGHGIDTESFKKGIEENRNTLKLLTVGRISKSKDYETLLKAVEICKKNKIKFELDIVGGPVRKEDKDYFSGLKKLAKENDLGNMVKFVGPVPNKNVAGHYQKADLFLHMSQTGSLDKALLEAMACELIIVSCNESAVNDVLPEYKNSLLYNIEDSEGLAERIKEISRLPMEERRKLGEKLRSIVVKHHNLAGLIKKIVKNIG